MLAVLVGCEGLCPPLQHVCTAWARIEGRLWAGYGTTNIAFHMRRAVELQVWKVIAFLLKFSAPKVLLRAQRGHNPECTAVLSPSPPLYVWLIDVSPSWCFPSFGEDLIPNTLLFPVLDPPYMHSPNSPGTLHTLNQIYNEMLPCATNGKRTYSPP